MMAPSRQPLVLAISLIVLGGGWLLNNLQIAPDVNWIWTLGLGIFGAVIFVLGGINKFTVVVAPFLMTASALSYRVRSAQSHDLCGDFKRNETILAESSWAGGLP